MPSRQQSRSTYARVVVGILLILLLLWVLQSMRPTGDVIASSIQQSPLEKNNQIPSALNARENVNWMADCDATGMINLCPLACLNFAIDEEGLNLISSCDSTNP